MRRSWKAVAPALLVGTLCLSIGLSIGLSVDFVRRQARPSDEVSTVKPDSADIPVPIVAAYATRQDVAIYRTGLGSVEAFNKVTVTSRVEGQLQSILFTEGQEVKAGAVLAQIDTRFYEAAAREKQAQLRSAQAKANAAKADLARTAVLFHGGTGTRKEFDNQTAQVEQSDAQVEAVNAELDNAELQLEYTTIHSPIDGRVGLKQLDAGNMIRLGDRTIIVVVTQVQPISVVFTLPQEDLMAVSKQLASGRSLPVYAMARDGKLDLGSGALSTIDNQVDPKTGTFKLKATFANDRKTLWPGEFVTVKLLIDHARNAIVIPAPAVQRGPQGPYVYVVSAMGTGIVEMRPVSVALIQEGFALIEGGIKEGERVVVDGQFKLRPGSRVVITSFQSRAPALVTTSNQPPG
jgi:membrane fusion protein, multidrug efflux system